MKLLIGFLVLFVLCVSVFGFTKLEKLSTKELTDILKLMDNIKNTENNTHLKQTLKELTDLDYDEKIRSELYELIRGNENHTSVFMRLAGLITFKNIFLTCMVLIGVALAISLFKDIIFALGAFVALVIVQVILDKRFLYTVGLGFSCAIMYINPSNIENQIVRILFIFDWLSPLFGCLIFGIIAFAMYRDFVITSWDLKGMSTRHGGYDEENNYIPIGFIVTLVWGVVTVYHQNWVIGIVTIIMLFFTFGFLFGAMFGGYYTGFVGTAAMARCFIVSLILNACMVGIQTGVINGTIVDYFGIFETGIYFWGTFVGCLAMLIMSDEYFILKMAREAESRMKVKIHDILPYFMLMQILMGVYCLGTMYVGSILYITTFKSIGGTFLVLWGLDLEKTVLKKFGTGHLTITLLIILANCYAVYKLISWYPEYFIFSF